ncbi:MAG TPA: S41 family peptidase, partial [Blastocatellia bacterium]|nr:S41 family peptidase [Blastocatellia bacterium]
KIAGLFFQNRQPFGSFISRTGKPSVLVADPQGKKAYAGPVAILVDVSSGSGSELFASVMQESHRASIIGRTSCGCLLGIEHFKKLKGGGDLAISELDYVSPNGQKIEGRGVVPDLPVPLTLADLASGRDSMLVVAENKLSETAGNTTTAVQPRTAVSARQTANRRPQVTATPPVVPAHPHRH